MLLLDLEVGDGLLQHALRALEVGERRALRLSAGAEQLGRARVLARHDGVAQQRAADRPTARLGDNAQHAVVVARAAARPDERHELTRIRLKGVRLVRQRVREAGAQGGVPPALPRRGALRHGTAPTSDTRALVK